MSEFLIAANDRRAGPFVAGAGQTVFPYDFPLFDAADIAVYAQASGAATATLLASSAYSVTGIGDAVGGTIVLGTGATAGTIYSIRGARNPRRTTDFSEAGDFRAETLNRELDLLAQTAQEQAAGLVRALRLAETDTASTTVLPTAAARAGLMLGFDALGNLIAASPGTLALGTGDVTGDKIAAGAVDLSKLAAEVIAALGGGSASIVAGEALADRDLVYQDVFNQRGGGVDRWYKVDADAISPVRISPRIGIALAAIASGASGLAQVRAGAVSGFSGLTPGLLCFAGGTAGIITQTAPAIPANGAQNATREIGTALSATSIDFKPHERTVFTGRGTAVAVDGTIVLQHWTDDGAREREQAAYLVQALSTALVAGATGSNIGDFTVNGGLAGIFDGNTNQDNAGCGAKLSTTSGYAGKTYSPGKKIAQAVVWGGNATGAEGYVSGANPTITLVLRGKTGAAPSSRTDGTSLGSVSFTDTGNESGNPRTIASSDTNTTWDHVWIDFSHSGSAAACFIAEIQFTESTGAARDEPLTIGSTIVNATATDRVNVRYDDGSGSNADTRTTFLNRTGATRDMAVEVVL
jgi:hypothetical protein